MRARRETVKEVTHVLVKHAVVGQGPRKARQLGPGWEIAVDQQVRRFDERGVLRELLDRVAAVQEDSFLAVDEGDLALGRPGVHVTGVERDEPGVLPEVSDVDAL